MGYRSEVAIRCEANAYERFKNVFSKKELYITPDKIRHDDEYDEYIIQWDWIKWYESYDGIKEIIKVMDKLDEEHEIDLLDRLGYRFMRLGEDDTDIETRENDYDLELWMNRSIDIPDWEEVSQ